MEVGKSDSRQSHSFNLPSREDHPRDYTAGGVGRPSYPSTMATAVLATPSTSSYYPPHQSSFSSNGFPPSSAASTPSGPGLLSPVESRRTSDDHDMASHRQALPSIQEVIGKAPSAPSPYQPASAPSSVPQQSLPSPFSSTAPGRGFASEAPSNRQSPRTLHPLPPASTQYNTRPDSMSTFPHPLRPQPSGRSHPSPPPPPPPGADSQQGGLPGPAPSLHQQQRLSLDRLSHEQPHPHHLSEAQHSPHHLQHPQHPQHPLHQQHQQHSQHSQYPPHQQHQQLQHHSQHQPQQPYPHHPPPPRDMGPKHDEASAQSSPYPRPLNQQHPYPPPSAAQQPMPPPMGQPLHSAYPVSPRHSVSASLPSPFDTHMQGGPDGPQDYNRSRSRYDQTLDRHFEAWSYAEFLARIGSNARTIFNFAEAFSIIAREEHGAQPIPGRMPGDREVCEMISNAQWLKTMLENLRGMVQQTQTVVNDRGPGNGRPKPSGFDDLEVNMYSDPASKPYAINEVKKRRGRAAPPGRCHSCNRIDTPEWRRGPDGARTLCNACGLHYAKLERKKQLESRQIRP